MFLSDTAILAGIDAGDIMISDFSQERLQPASYDIRLSHRFLVIRGHESPIIDPVKKILPVYDEVILEEDGSFTLHPGTTILGMSMEKFGSEKYLIQLSGKSSLARLGLIVHNTAGLINPGHYLNITFELANMNSVPIVLRPGMEIAQLLFAEMTGSPSRGYRETGRYHDGEDNFTSYLQKK